MSISLSLFYYLYLLLLLVFLVFSFFHVYHLLRFSALNLLVIFVIALYCVVAAGMLIFSWNYINQVDWQQSIELLPNPLS